MKAGWFLAPLMLVGGCSTTPVTVDQASILRVDELQRELVATSDVAGLQRLAHANLRINAPGGEVLDREQFLQNMSSGKVAADSFERVAEDVSVSGNIAVIMGHEIYTPTASSELGKTYGAKPLKRRYTNIYVWEKGEWRWLGRHANILPAS